MIEQFSIDELDRGGGHFRANRQFAWIRMFQERRFLLQKRASLSQLGSVSILDRCKNERDETKARQCAGMAHAGMLERGSSQPLKWFHFAALVFFLKDISKIETLLRLLVEPTRIGTQHAFQWLRIELAKALLRRMCHDLHPPDRTA